MSDDIGFENIASSCRHEYAHYEDEMFRDSFDPEVLLMAADEIDRLTKILASRKVADNTYVRIEQLWELVEDLVDHLRGYMCHCNLGKCKCGYDDVMNHYREVRGE